jgi:hypothetical protein
MNKIDKRWETRRQNALDRLGTNDPCCSVCGVDDPSCLELHHVAGRKNDELTVIVCRNHHRMLSSDQKDHPLLMPEATPSLSVLFNLLLGLADFFQLLAQRLREMVASYKTEHVTTLGANT